ncbi:uncharacterized [Tachysurus ichikawai]
MAMTLTSQARLHPSLTVLHCYRSHLETFPSITSEMLASTSRGLTAPAQSECTMANGRGSCCSSICPLDQAPKHLVVLCLHLVQSPKTLFLYCLQPEEGLMCLVDASNDLVLKL